MDFQGQPAPGKSLENRQFLIIQWQIMFLAWTSLGSSGRVEILPSFSRNFRQLFGRRSVDVVEAWSQTLSVLTEIFIPFQQNLSSFYQIFADPQTTLCSSDFSRPTNRRRRRQARAMFIRYENLVSLLSKWFHSLMCWRQASKFNFEKPCIHFCGNGGNVFFFIYVEPWGYVSYSIYFILYSTLWLNKFFCRQFWWHFLQLYVWMIAPIL